MGAISHPQTEGKGRKGEEAKRKILVIDFPFSRFAISPFRPTCRRQEEPLCKQNSYE
jgi:hypothetical protein